MAERVVGPGHPPTRVGDENWAAIGDIVTQATKDRWLREILAKHPGFAKKLKRPVPPSC